MKNTMLPAVCLLAVSLTCFASGKSEGKPKDKPPAVSAGSGETAFKAYLILAEKDTKGESIVTQTLLPPVVGLYAWSPFTVKDDVPRVSSDSTFSTVRRNGTSAGSAGSVRILVYDMAVLFAKKPAGIPGKEIRLEFSVADLTTSSGEVRFQPAVWAALEAARRSGKKSGSLRVLEAVPAGENGFQARVEVR